MSMAMIPKFVWFEYVSSDERKAQAFFGELFHWKTTPAPLPTGSYTMIALGADTIGGYIGPDPALPKTHAFWLPHLQVGSARDAAARVTTLGGKVLREPQKLGDYGTTAVAADPQGAMFAVWEAASHEDGGEYRTVDGGFGWNELYTQDPEASLAFYQGMGFDAERVTMYGLGPDRYDILSSDGRGRAGVMQLPNVPPHWMPYVKVASADAIVETAKRLGATFKLTPETIPNVGRLAVMIDPLGAPLGILQPSPL